MTQSFPYRTLAKARLPEIRARRFDRERDPATQIENLLSRKQQTKLRAISTVLEYHRNDTTVFSEGEDAYFVYSVISGVVRISRHSNNGRRQVLALMLPGDLFGLPDAGLYVNTAETVCPTSLYRVPWEQLRQLMLREPEMQINLLIRTAFDLRQAQRRIMILGQQNITQRLGSFLLDFMQYPEFYNAGRRELVLPLTRFDLGDYLGTAPETVVRAFAKLEKEGLVRRLAPRLIEIPDAGRLRTLVGGRRRARRT
jgi:CRP/FNR family transcriptional regulator, anaerobic regulatory protein